MKKSAAILITSAVLSLYGTHLIAANSTTSQTSTTASTQEATPAPFQAAQDKLKQMTPEQRKAFIKEAHDKWQKMSKEEKVKFENDMKDKIEQLKQRKQDRKLEKVYSLYLLEQQQ